MGAGPGAGASGLTLSPPGGDRGREVLGVGPGQGQQIQAGKPRQALRVGVLERGPGRAQPLWVLRAREGAVTPFSHPPGDRGRGSPHCAGGATEAPAAGHPLVAASPSLSFSLGTQRSLGVHRGHSSGL